MSPLAVVRHGPPLVEGICAGRSDVPVEAAAAVASRIFSGPHSFPMHLEGIITSPTRRCFELAAEMASRRGVRVRIDPRITELDFGDWEGKSWKLVAEEDRARFDEWSGAWLTTAPPAGESLTDLVERIDSFLKDVLPCENQLIVTHAGVIRALRVLLLGETWPEAMGRSVPYGVVEVIEPRASSARRV